MDVNFSTAFFGLWEISQGGLPGSFPVPSAHYARLSHLVSLLVHVRVVTIIFFPLFSISLVIRMELLQSFLVAP